MFQMKLSIQENINTILQRKTCPQKSRIIQEKYTNKALILDFDELFELFNREEA